VRDRKGRFTTNDFPGALVSGIYKNNNRGQIVGAFVNREKFGGFLLEDGRFTLIDFPWHESHPDHGHQRLRRHGRLPRSRWTNCRTPSRCGQLDEPHGNACRRVGGAAGVILSRAPGRLLSPALG
jgi:hypothetical protein